MPSKHALSSKTIIGVLVSLIFKLLALYGVEVSPDLQGDVLQLAFAAVSVAGDALAVYGRFKAERPISLRGAGRALLAAVLLAGLAAGGPVACASYTAATAEHATPAQQVYALQGDYNAALEVAAAYVESDRADPDAVTAIRRLDAAAYAALREARTAVRAEDDPTWPAALAAARSAVEALADYVRTHRTQEK